jgi:hypothetical protein
LNATWGFALFALLALPCGAGAAEGLFLSWNACANDPESRQDKVAGCASDIDEQVLDCAFTLGFPLDSVVALEVVVDVQVSGGTLPDWWRLEPGGCRAPALVGATVFPSQTPCEDFWQGRAATPKQAFYFPGQPRGGASQARIVLACALLPDSAERLEASTMYHAVRLVLRNQRTSQCPGCALPACLVLNSILVGRLPGAPGGDLLIQTPGPDLANRATWQGGAGECAAVPVRPGSWGRIKSLYR